MLRKNKQNVRYILISSMKSGMDHSHLCFPCKYLFPQTMERQNRSPKITRKLVSHVARVTWWCHHLEVALMQHVSKNMWCFMPVAVAVFVPLRESVHSAFFARPTSLGGSHHDPTWWFGWKTRLCRKYSCEKIVHERSLCLALLRYTSVKKKHLNRNTPGI